jgi:regulatory protein
MAVITAIEAQKRDPERVSVFVDGEFAFGASRLLVAQHRLKTGSELTPSLIETLRHDDDVDRSFNAALNYLSYRPRSTREIEQYLRRRKVADEVAGAVIARLQRIGMLDDGEFARFWVENRMAFRPRGTRALKVELRQKGVSGEIIEAALEGMEDEEPAAYEAAKAKLRSFASLDDRQFFTRMIGFLQRRGYPYAVAARVVKRLQEERSGEVTADIDDLPLE